MTPPCHAERSVSEVKHPYWIPRCARNDTKSARHDTVPAMTKVLGITSPVMLNKVSIHAESPHPVSAMPKRPSPFEGEGRVG